jgi:hypothetical protein
MINRREFIAAGAAAMAVQAAAPQKPWYRRVTRWGQTNITEKDPIRYDIAWWRQYWKRTKVQGVIINAGGIVAYYPSKFPLQHRAEFLGDRDLYGELAKAAHEDGLVVIARMDSNRASEDFFKAHPDWFTRDAKGNPYRVDERYVTCVNGPYYDEYLPSVITEIIERSHPEGFADNSWSGLNRTNICYCANCARLFRNAASADLPTKHDWDDPVYRRWIDWNYARRNEIWEINNRATKAAGGPDCLWFGMNSGSVSSQSRSFRDCKTIFGRAEMVFLDHQSRGASGFEENSDTGKLVHSLLGWDKFAPESMAMYEAGRNSFRLSSKPAVEARMWMIEGFAGGIQPWWHHVGAFQEDRRAFHTAEPEMTWYAEHERYLIDRQPLANIGVVWSQRNTDFYGRDNAADLTDAPYRGYVQALMRGRIPYVPVHVDSIDREAGRLKALILPNIAAMTDAQCASVRAFVKAGGGIVATGATSLYTEFGDARNDYGLSDLFGAHAAGKAGEEKAWAARNQHTYLRISKQRHSALQGFEETDILPYGGGLGDLRLDTSAVAALTFIPPFPVLPPETAWMRTPETNIPGLVINGRVAFLPADVDRRYAREPLPDYATLLASLARWAAGGESLLELRGPGVFDCNLYTQPGRVMAHLVNLTAAARMPMDELIPVGPMHFGVRLPDGVTGRRVKTLVSGAALSATVANGWTRVTVPSVLDHEVLVIE